MSYGPDYTPSRTIFRLWAPHAASVVLQRFNRGSEAEAHSFFLGEHAMERGDDGVFAIQIPGDLKNQYYQYLVTDQDGHEVATADPWALSCGINGRRSMVVDLKATDPPGWETDHRLPPAQGAPAIYELHVGDFSGDPRSGIPERDRGRFTAFSYENTTLNGDGIHPTCLNYLKQLGITHVQLQPIADYCTIDERRTDMYNWGYDPENYNIPEGSYSTNPWCGEVRIRECKEMIQALHRAGIRVVLDVVYNHTYRKNSWLQFTAPGEYYRYMPDGTWANASGCGTETASDRPPFRQYMLESLLYWAEEYHVDGFRFDLMAIHDVETMNLIRNRMNRLPGGEHILLYGEPWSALPTRMRPDAIPATKAVVRQMEGVGIFCDDTRNTLVGSTFDPHAPGYVTLAHHEENIKRLKAAIRGWSDRALMGYAKSPGQILQYVSCHDNYTLWDRLCIQAGKMDFFSQDPERIQLCKLASGICLTTRGLAFFLAGEEFGRSKDGWDNTFNGPAVLNRLDWTRSANMTELVEWYRGLLALRPEIAPASLLNAPAARKIYFLKVPHGCVAFQYPLCGKWKKIAVYYQPHPTPQRVVLPVGNWQVLVDGHRSDLWQGQMKTVSVSYTLPPKSVVIFGRA